MHSALVRLAAILSILLASSVSMSAHAAGSDYPRVEDVSTIDGLIRAYYDVVSGPANTPRDVVRDRSLHHADARIFAPDKQAQGGTGLRSMTVEQFHQWSKSVYDAGFYEREVGRTVRTFGNSTHVWSTYETRATPDGPVVGRGINNIVLHFDGKRYTILAETWDSERAGNPMPKGAD